jgi:hypothetical protein
VSQPVVTVHCVIVWNETYASPVLVMIMCSYSPHLVALVCEKVSVGNLFLILNFKAEKTDKDRM